MFERKLYVYIHDHSIHDFVAGLENINGIESNGKWWRQKCYKKFKQK